MLTQAEHDELAALNAAVRERNAEGRYYRWTQTERDRVRELMRRRDPWIRFAPSTEHLATLFGRENRR